MTKNKKGVGAARLKLPTDWYLPPPGYYYDEHDISSIFGDDLDGRICMHCLDPDCLAYKLEECEGRCGICGSDQHQGKQCPQLYCGEAWHKAYHLQHTDGLPIRPTAGEAELLAAQNIILRPRDNSNEIGPVMTNPLVERLYRGQSHPKKSNKRPALPKTSNSHSTRPGWMHNPKSMSATKAPEATKFEKEMAREVPSNMRNTAVPKSRYLSPHPARQGKAPRQTASSGRMGPRRETTATAEHLQPGVMKETAPRPAIAKDTGELSKKVFWPEERGSGDVDDRIDFAGRKASTAVCNYLWPRNNWPFNPDATEDLSDRASKLSVEDSPTRGRSTAYAYNRAMRNSSMKAHHNYTPDPDHSSKVDLIRDPAPSRYRDYLDRNSPEPEMSSRANHPRESFPSRGGSPIPRPDRHRDSTKRKARDEPEPGPSRRPKYVRERSPFAKEDYTLPAPSEKVPVRPANTQEQEAAQMSIYINEVQDLRCDATSLTNKLTVTEHELQLAYRKVRHLTTANKQFEEILSNARLEKKGLQQEVVRLKPMEAQNERLLQVEKENNRLRAENEMRENVETKLNITIEQLEAEIRHLRGRQN